MWTIAEINTEMILGKCEKKMTLSEIYQLVEKEGIKTGIAWGINENKTEVLLGTCISDEDCLKLFGLQ